MRLLWTIYAGFAFAGLVLLINLPVIGGGIAAAYLLRGELWVVLSGQSFFAVRDDSGRMLGQAGNLSFHVAAVPGPDSMRPRRMLLRLDARRNDVFGVEGGRVRLDAWPLDAAEDMRAPPAYSIVSPGTAATIDPDGMLMIENGSRRSLWSLSDGRWLFDSDAPLASFLADGERRRLFAVALAEDDLPPGAVAVLAYATPQKAVRRLILSVEDEARAGVIKVSVPLSRPVARLADDGKRTAEVALSAGLVRIPIEGDTLAIGAAVLPQGMKLTEIAPWRD